MADDGWGGTGEPGAKPRAAESSDYGRTFDEDQDGALRDAAPSILEPISANAPVSGHRFRRSLRGCWARVARTAILPSISLSVGQALD